MEQKILVEELAPTTANLITESAGDEMFLSGIFMQADIKNRNGRVYPISEISAAVRGAQQRISESKGIMGELDHPQTLTINLDRVSHIITELDVNGSNAIGKAKLLNTPMGNIAKEIIRSGVAMGVSSRGAGAVNESGGVSGFNFVTVDIVAQPSAPNAYPQTVYEGLEQAQNGHNIMDLAEAVRHDAKAQEYLVKEIKSWLSTGVFAKRK